MMKGLLSAVFSGLLLVLSFPRFDLDYIAWVALIPLLLAIKGKGRTASFLYAYITGMVFLMGVFYWINIIDGFRIGEFLVLGIYLSLYFGLFGMLFQFVSQKNSLNAIFLGPALWISLEYFRSHAGFLALPWPLLGHSQYMNLALIQVTSIAGVYGVSFLIVMVNIALCEVIHKRTLDYKPALGVCAVLLVSFSYGFYQLQDEQGQERLPVTVIQGNIAQDVKWKQQYWNNNFERHEKLSREASAERVTSLIVWPESAVPGPIPYNQFMFRKMKDLARSIQSNLLIGTSVRPKISKGKDNEDKKGQYNSAILLSPQGRVTGQYNKMRPLPFAEYLPWRKEFPWPSRYRKINDYLKGDEYPLFNVKQANFGVLICWENIFPDLVRRFVQEGAQFIVNITNEGWFGETAAPYQFLSMSVFRAVENGVTIVRAANTGISGFIGPHGRINGKVNKKNKDIFIAGYLTQEVPLAHNKTFYTSYGDVFVFVNIMCAIFFCLFTLYSNSRQVRLLKTIDMPIPGLKTRT